MSTPDAGPPPLMAEELAAFCQDARRGRVRLYGQLLRENIAEALRSSFPLFVQRFGSVALEDAIDAFITLHPALRPQFHHIATEFVVFAQRGRLLSPRLTALLEYEWALLAAEIDPARVSPEGAAGAYIRLNPTARLVLLPFDPSAAAEPGVEGAGGDERPYALFRTADHRVLIQPLTFQDCLVVEQIRDAGAMLPETLTDLLVADLSPPDLQTSLAHGLACGLFCVTPEPIGEPS
ncbi:HvfC/BufC family peptide modification chaperone [Nitrospirillum pindoramense]|uniref:Putative DNA-binding domain-containing protein n=1 Tax=Nitrospirillum amazonense TaxID=28077 RepID=A0A560GVT6_9PROT|nr:putative DNA-binding domain-containing protein [Nitrospirillum amazonense]TWB38108.1 hypothetical protein FBZ90_113101 [Nitrospirillum amazonense]